MGEETVDLILKEIYSNVGYLKTKIPKKEK